MSVADPLPTICRAPPLITTGKLLSLLPSFWHALLEIPVAPYRRMLKIYTTQPLKEIRACSDIDEKLKLVKKWTNETKPTEMKIVRHGSIFAAAGTIGINSWPEIEHSMWQCRALLYMTFTFATWAMITSFQQTHILDELPTSRKKGSTKEQKLIQRIFPVKGGKKGKRYQLMIFVLQIPAMLHSYAWITLLLGLSLHLCSPLFSANWGGCHWTAVCYLLVAGICLSIWIAVSFLVDVTLPQDSHVETQVIHIDSV